MRHQLGQILRRQGDVDGGIQALETALALNPKLCEAYYSLGQTLKQLASAKRPRRAGRPPEPGAAEHFKRGAEAAARRDFAAAAELLRKAIESDGSYAEAPVRPSTNPSRLCVLKWPCPAGCTFDENGVALSGMGVGVGRLRW